MVLRNKKTLYHSIQLPGLTIPGNLFSAPLAGFSDQAFRQMNLEQGASIAFTEMVSCEALIRGSRKTLHLLEPLEGEKHLAVQVFSGTPESAAKAMSHILPFNPSLIDLNCGCPVPKIIKAGAGSALMKDPKKIGGIVRAIRRELPDHIPVSVKIRSGWDARDLTYREAAAAAIDSGAAMVTLHARTRTQGYSGTAEWTQIRELKELFQVPIIGSGDLLTPEDGKRMLEETNCDGLLFARGAIGNPFIFSQTRDLLESGVLPSPIPHSTRIETALLHLERSIKYRGELLACKEMRKHLSSYTKGIHGAAAFRNRIVHCKTKKEYQEVFRDILSHIESA